MTWELLITPLNPPAEGSEAGALPRDKAVWSDGCGDWGPFLPTRFLLRQQEEQSRPKILVALSKATFAGGQHPIPRVSGPTPACPTSSRCPVDISVPSAAAQPVPLAAEGSRPELWQGWGVGGARGVFRLPGPSWVLFSGGALAQDSGVRLHLLSAAMSRRCF